MPSSVRDVVKEAGVTPADPFDRGAGSIRVDRAAAAAVTFDVTADEYVAAAADPLDRIKHKLTSLHAPQMAGEVTTQRTMTNVSGDRLQFRVSTDAPPGSTI